MYCPFAKYTDGSFRDCHQSNCMAYNKQDCTCKLVEGRTGQVIYYPYEPVVQPSPLYPTYITCCGTKESC